MAISLNDIEQAAQRIGSVIADMHFEKSRTLSEITVAELLISLQIE